MFGGFGFGPGPGPGGFGGPGFGPGGPGGPGFGRGFGPSLGPGGMGPSYGSHGFHGFFGPGFGCTDGRIPPFVRAPKKASIFSSCLLSLALIIGVPLLALLLGRFLM